MAFEVFPAVDILEGKCVRLLQGDYEFKSTYYANPLEPAKKWEDAGASWLHIIDLDGAKEGKPVNLELIKKMVETTDLKIQIGGGIRSVETAEIYLNAGVSRVIVGSKAINDPSFAKELVDNFGADKIVVSVDGKDNQALSEGWIEDSGKSLIQVAEELVAVGVENYIFTDTDKDGTLLGPNLEMALALAEIVPKGIIVAGGIGCPDDVLNLKNLESKGISGAVIGRAIYTGEIVLEELLKDLKEG